MVARSFKDTKVFKLAFQQAMEIYEITKTFPKEETYSLTDQIRRSSGSVCTNLAEAYRKKRYPVHFISKITDSDVENSETGVWFNFALAYKYITKQKNEEMVLRGCIRNFRFCPYPLAKGIPSGKGE